MTALVDRYPDQTWALRQLLQYHLGRKDLVRAQALYAQLIRLDPGDVTLTARGAMLCLLRGVDCDQASAILRNCRQREPRNPVVATVVAYDFYLRGDFNQALATMGGLAPAELDAPERAVYLGALLAVGGSLDQAETDLRSALARPELFDEERALADRSLSLVAYRRGMARLLASSLPMENSYESFVKEDNAEILLVGRSVELARSGSGSEALHALAQVNVRRLDNPGLSIYSGAVLYLTGNTRGAIPYLELSADMAAESSKSKLHRALSFWWGRQEGSPLESEVMTGLFQTYAGLQRIEADPVFWRGDADRELNLIRTALLHRCGAGAINESLQVCFGHARNGGSICLLAPASGPKAGGAGTAGRTATFRAAKARAFFLLRPHSRRVR